jgi:hypothetical protein
MGRGRPPELAREVEIFIHLRLREGQDNDLIAFFQEMPARRRALYLKAALRSGGVTTRLQVPADDDDETLNALANFLQ